MANMPYSTTHTNLIKLWNLPLTWAKARLLALTQRLFAAGDTAARQHGWQVNSMHGGFGRSYRDPRFDAMTSCGDCRGRSITTPGSPCQTCGGTGRIIIEPAAELPSNPPQDGLT